MAKLLTRLSLDEESWASRYSSDGEAGVPVGVVVGGAGGVQIWLNAVVFSVFYSFNP
jgi:hypothetical protein